MEINEEIKRIVSELGSAINSAVENSSQVANAIGKLREAGYESQLTIRLEIGLKLQSEDEDQPEAGLELTDEDRRTLRSMKIRIDDLE